jgi:hypothetical protein
LKQQIDWKGTDPAERSALLEQLKDIDAGIEAKLAAEADKQQSSLADRLAKRRNKKAQLAREECNLKMLQDKEASQKAAEVRQQQRALRGLERTAAFDEKFDKIVMEKSQAEVPGAVLEALEDKH